MVEQQIIAVAEEIAQAIGARDADRLRALLAPGFTHRTHGGTLRASSAFWKVLQRSRENAGA